MPSLVEYLHDFARRASAETPRLEAELTEIQTRKLDIENKLQAAHLAWIARPTLSRKVASRCIARSAGFCMNVGPRFTAYQAVSRALICLDAMIADLTMKLRYRRP
jgi:hypothetical protein